MKEIINNIWIQRSFWSIITLIILVIIYKIISRILTNRIEKGLSNKKSKTYIRMIKSITRYSLIIIGLLIILQIFGINVTSMIAAAGIASIIIAFAIQDALKDIIKGFDIISDSYYQVGDVIKYGTITGKVTAIGLKTTKLEDIYTSNKVSISNRNIEQVEIISNLINIDIPLPYELDVLKAEEILNEKDEEIRKEEKVENVEYRGINNLSDSSLDYQIKVYCEPIVKIQTRRDSLRHIMLVLNKHKIAVPYKQIDIHQ